ncbi:MAG: class I tRNA ligase family protein, partial [Bacteroidota bacterium]|nr:class I tRNA ligase family protein [Bacteroidota bacterium]
MSSPKKDPEPHKGIRASLPKTYNARDYEDEIYQKWEKSGFFNPDVCVKKGICKKDEEVFSLMMPPPNVTGVLHLGHALENSLMDLMTRYQRMQGKRTLFLPGTDHAAVATQSRVERDLIESGKYKNPRQELGRETLLKIIREYSKDCKTTILKQIKKLGSSCDWSRLAYTFDEERSMAVNTMFKKMYDDGLIYQGKRIVNWDPRMQTTVADDEVEYIEEKTKFYYLQYGPMVIATARPETKFGDKYLVMHPDDKRYKKYKHRQKIDVEWINGKITATIIKDKTIDMEFGSGVMTITPWHDMTDFEIAERHNLDYEQIIDFNGKLLDVACEFSGIHIKKARPKIVEKLEKKGLLVKVEDNYAHSIAVNYRGKGVIEPQIMEQWFVDVNKVIPCKNKSLKNLMREAVTTGHNNDEKQKVEITPKRFQKNYLHWIDNLRDWCISRQIWWGHRIPVWYCDKKTLKHKNTKTWGMKIYGKDTFEAINIRTKTIETRAGRKRGEGKYWGDMKPGDVIEFCLADSKTDKIIKSEALIKRMVKKVSHFKSIDEMLRVCSVETISPGKNASNIKKWWKKYPKLNERIKKYGIWAIELDKTTPQSPPCQGGD